MIVYLFQAWPFFWLCVCCHNLWDVCWGAYCKRELCWIFVYIANFIWHLALLASTFSIHYRWQRSDSRRSWSILHILWIQLSWKSVPQDTFVWVLNTQWRWELLQYIPCIGNVKPCLKYIMSWIHNIRHLVLETGVLHFLKLDLLVDPVIYSKSIHPLSLYLQFRVLNG